MMVVVLMVLRAMMVAILLWPRRMGVRVGVRVRLQFLGHLCGGGGAQAGVREGSLTAGAHVVEARGRGVHAGPAIFAANRRAVDERRETRHLDQLVERRLVLERQRLVRHTLFRLALGGALGALDGGRRLLARRVGAGTGIGGGSDGGGRVVQRVEPPAGLPVRQPLGWRAVIVLRLGDEVVAINIVVRRALRVLVAEKEAKK